MKAAVSRELAVVSSWLSMVGWRGFILSCLLTTAYCLPGCSVPNLEARDCTEAREMVKEFYSYHFGNDMHFTPENLKQREKFLTPELVSDLQSAPADRDPFTLTDDLPKAFRVGGCKVAEPGRKVDFGVLMFWKTDTRSEEREIDVEAVKQNDKWLINKVSGDKK